MICRSSILVTCLRCRRDGSCSRAFRDFCQYAGLSIRKTDQMQQVRQCGLEELGLMSSPFRAASRWIEIMCGRFTNKLT